MQQKAIGMSESQRESSGKTLDNSMSEAGSMDNRATTQTGSGVHSGKRVHRRVAGCAPRPKRALIRFDRRISPRQSG